MGLAYWSVAWSSADGKVGVQGGKNFLFFIERNCFLKSSTCAKHKARECADRHAGSSPGPRTVSTQSRAREMADRDGGVELPVAPGQAYIEVEFDYEYKAKDKLVTIRQGECYMLVRKTNDDWWQVRKDRSAKAFYVPAQYVREVRKALMPPPKPLLKGGSGKAKPAVLEIRRSNENLNRHAEMSSFGRPTPGHCSPPGGRRDANQNPGSPGRAGARRSCSRTTTAVAAAPRCRGRAPSRPCRAAPDGDAERTPSLRLRRRLGEAADSESGAT
ncbi:hypothetical protein ANANG_G00083010 [Anguilla anguilla]|uniref:SH3 domain-containing protein n=1 Tax=Anguilla anguilla TaxID=7936 RepID=A0A9D3MKB4_ANGAN|nr:hypothetical protein ANANG_G00083010 [Anguilla anguilla]